MHRHPFIPAPYPFPCHVPFLIKRGCTVSRTPPSPLCPGYSLRVHVTATFSVVCPGSHEFASSAHSTAFARSVTIFWHFSLSAATMSFQPSPSRSLCILVHSALNSASSLAKIIFPGGVFQQFRALAALVLDIGGVRAEAGVDAWHHGDHAVLEQIIHGIDCTAIGLGPLNVQRGLVLLHRGRPIVVVIELSGLGIDGEIAHDHAVDFALAVLVAAAAPFLGYGGVVLERGLPHFR